MPVRINCPPEVAVLTLHPARPNEPPAVQLPASLEHDPYRLRIEPMLLDEDSCRQRLHRVGIEHRHGGLKHDWAAIELRRHQMHGRAAHAHAVLQRLPLRVEPRKRGQQRRVNVEDAIRERLEQRRADAPHETGETDEADIAIVQEPDDHAIVIVASGVITRPEIHGFDPGRPRARKTVGFRPIGDHNRDRRVEFRAGRRIDDRLEVAAAPGDENGEPAVHEQIRVSAHRRVRRRGRDLADAHGVRLAGRPRRCRNT